VLARFFVNRPIFAWVISIVIMLVGGVAVFVLPVAQYPDISPPTVSVTCTYPGASAQVVADSVAAPIEQQVNGVERMMYMSSQCTNDGVYTLTITFELGTDLNMAQVLVQNRVALAMPQLPQEVQLQGVSTKKKSPSILLVVNLISPDGSYDDLYLSNYATVKVRDELLRVSGVGDINYLGQRDYSMRIWLDPDKMSDRNITTGDVLSAVKKQNVQVAAGQIGRPPIPHGQQFQYTMSTKGRLAEDDEFGDIIIKTATPKTETITSTQVVRIKDIARVELGAQQYDQIAQLDGRPTVGLAVYQLPGSNALGVADKIRESMETLKKQFPAGVDYQIAYDTTPFIKQSVEEVFLSLRDAIILVAIVVLLFLQDWKAMILPMIDVPVSLIGTFAVMYLLGFTLNNLTLLAMVLAIGIVVDDAIVVLENIERFIGLGYEPKEATIRAMDEITGPIIGITLVLCAVFIPAACITGISGQFFRQFALVIASSVIISAINAMTLTPARAVTIFKTAAPGEHGHEHLREALPWWFFGILSATIVYMVGFADLYDSIVHFILPGTTAPPKWLPWLVYSAILLPVFVIGAATGLVIIKPVNKVLAGLFGAFNRVFDRITAVYGAIVARSLRVAFIVLIAYGGLLFATYWGMTTAPTGFIPMQDQGYLLVNVQLPDSASLERTNAVMNQLQRMALGDDTGLYFGPPGKNGKKYPGIPGAAHTVSVAGMSFLLNTAGSNLGSMFISLKPFDERTSHDEYDEVVAQQMRKLANVDIEDAIVTVFRAPPIQGLGSAGGFKLQIQQKGFVNLPELQQATDEFVRTANADKRLVGMFSMFRAETPQLYVDIDRTKCESMQVPVDDVFNTLQVFMGGYFANLFNKFGRTWQVNLLADEQFRAQAERLRMLKVRNKLGDMVPLGSLATIKDIGGPVMIMRYNMYTSAAVNGNSAPGVSTGQAIGVVTEIADKLGVPFEWTEITYMQIQAGNVAIFAFALGSLVVYLVLAAQYESWAEPAAVILVVPMCLLCSVASMLIVKMPVDIFVQIGFLVLVALAAKNAILIVEFARERLKHGQPVMESVIEACRLRLRPIIMTSFAFTLGVVPLMLGHGAGAEMRQSLGIAVFGGMLGVTFFGIFLTPVFYFLLMRRVGPSVIPATGTPATTTPGADGHAQTTATEKKPAQ